MKRPNSTAKTRVNRPSKYPSKLARALARSENVYGGKRDKGLKR